MVSYLKKQAIKPRFIFWLVIFGVMLMVIPLFLILHLTVLAKITGVVVVVLISIALRLWRLQTLAKRNKVLRIKMTLNERFWLERHVAFYYFLSKSDKIVFEDRIGLFLAEIIITEKGKEIPEKSTCLLVAASSIIAFWDLPFWDYGDLREVMVYSDEVLGQENTTIEGEVTKSENSQEGSNSILIMSLSALSFGLKQSSKNKSAIDNTSFLNKELYESWFKLIKKYITENLINDFENQTDQQSNKSEFFSFISRKYNRTPDLFKHDHFQLYNFIQEILIKKA